MEEIIRNARDDRFPLSERKRIVLPELVPERSTNVNKVKLVRSVTILERIDERVLGVTDDRRVVSDRPGLLESRCCLIPESLRLTCRSVVSESSSVVCPRVTLTSWYVQ